MSYARWGNGDVYVFGTVDNTYICMCCSMEPEKEIKKSVGLFSGFSGMKMRGDFECGTRPEMIIHLEQHIELGETVPAEAIKRLEDEIKDE